MKRYAWARIGDLNAFFGLMLDNAAVMVLLVSLISSTTPPEEQQDGQLRFTPGFVLTRMIPGTAFGVLLGDLVYTWMAFRLARRTGRDNVTAMPLGLDTPSTFGIPFLVVLPALQHGGSLFPGDHAQAMEFAWHVGVVVLLISGIFKVLVAPFGNLIRRLIPRAGLLGSLAAIALTLIAFLPLLDDIAKQPIIGMAALVIILIALIAHRELPGRFPGALAAVLVGLGIMVLGQALNKVSGWSVVPPFPQPVPRETWQPGAWMAFYEGDGPWWQQVGLFALGKLPVALPFALATVVGGIDCTESAAAVGDEYDTVAVLGTEGFAAIAAALFGGVIQTTPYIGHPAYKKMGGRAAYTLATALFVGAAGFFGWFTILFDWIPRAAMFPILVFVGLEITAQSFHATPTRHYPALAFAMLPALAYLIKILVDQVLIGNQAPPFTLETIQALRCLANGFLISGMLWAAALVMVIDGKLMVASFYFEVAAVFAFFGVIHSPLPSEQLGLPGQVLAEIAQPFQEAVRYQTPYHWAAAYSLLALITFGLTWVPVSEVEQAFEKKD